MSPEIRKAKLLQALGLEDKHLFPYPTLDPNDPNFSQKFDFEKWMTDARYAIESFMRIDTKEQTIVPFKLNIVQLAFLFHRTGRDVLLKARQHGLTTFMLAYYLWQTITRPATRTVVVTHEKEASEALLARARLMYSSIPQFIRPALARDSKGILEFEGLQGSRFQIQILKRQADPEKAGATGRSKTINNLLLSEPAFYAGFEDKDFLGLTQAVPEGESGSITVESTPNGVGGFFYDECESARQVEGDKKYFYLPWTINPAYDDEWKRKRQRERELNPKSEGGRRNWSQEYECDFLQSQNSFFPMEVWAPDASRGIRIKTDPSGEEYPWYAYIYIEPDPDDLYVVGADTAQGLDHGDYSSATVLSRKHRLEVAHLYGHIKPEKFAEALFWLGMKYNEAFLGVENAGSGMVTVHLLEKEFNYRNLFYYINEYSKKFQVSSSPGWSTNTATRDVMLAEMRRGLVEGNLILAFPKREHEMRTFRIYDGYAKAAPKKNDDTIISGAIANRLLDFPEAIRRDMDVEIEVRSYGT